MLVDFQKALLDLHGNSVMKPDSTSPARIADVCEEALMGVHQDDNALSGAEKVKRFVIAMKIASSKMPLEITIEEAAELKRLVARHYGPLIVGRVWEIIDASSNGQS